MLMMDTDSEGDILVVESPSVLPKMSENLPENFSTCLMCNKNFMNEAALKSHSRWVHNNQIHTEHRCNKCEKSFPKSYNLKRHLQTVHDGVTKMAENVKCFFCSFVAHSKTLVSAHYQNAHDIDLTPKTVMFDTVEEFMQWKKDSEKNTNSQFIKPLSSRKRKDGSEVHTYICHRDGNYVPKGSNRRSLKVQGSNKINAHCPSKITMQKCNDGVKVNYIDTHVGHELEIGRMSIDQSERALIAKKLEANIPFRQILDEIRDSVTNEQFNRIHLLCRKDLWNIAHSFNIKLDGALHKSDFPSVDSWVTHMQSSSNTIRMYKPQGTLMEGFSELTSDDFFLVIMNEAQKELLESFGEDCICIDGTHGMGASCDFQLYILMVLDDLRQGFPCAFLFSNRGDAVAMKVFFKTLKEALKHAIKPTIFMSDVDDTFYNAWCAVMEPAERTLYCSWHVDRDWRNALNKITDQEEQAIVYKDLKVLMYQTDEEAFTALFPNFFEDLNENPNTQEFGKYFKKYTYSTTKWAFCFRKESDVSTYMNLENMHRVLKYVYCDGNKGRSMDKAIHMLMKFIREKLFDRNILLKKGKATSKLTELKACHKKALALKDCSVIEAENNWLVQSTRHKDIYVVSPNNVECECLLRCDDCEACIHAYQCTCIDSSIKWNMCKHTHLVGMFLKNRVQEIPQLDISSECIIDWDEPQVIVVEVTTERDEIFEKRKQDALDSVMKIHKMIQNEEQLQIFENHIASLESDMNELCDRADSNCEVSTEESPSKKIKI